MLGLLYLFSFYGVYYSFFFTADKILYQIPILRVIDEIDEGVSETFIIVSTVISKLNRLPVETHDM